MPDIIITPTTDDMPSQVIMQQHIKAESRESPKRAHSVEIEELVIRPKTRNICTNKEQVIDMLSQRLANINKMAAGNTQANLSRQLQKKYAGELPKELGVRSPSENTSPVQTGAVRDDSEDSSDEDTPKQGGITPLQAIKSVTNVQVYKGQAKIPAEQLDSESEDDDEDVTTADEMYDEEVEECLIEDLKDEYAVEEDLSVIYEEESELERSNDYTKTVISNATNGIPQVAEEVDLEQHIEDNDDDDESNSVTVRLPLRFSFSHSSNNEKFATVQVGSTTHIEEKFQSLNLDRKRNSFSVAKVEREDEDDNDCEVSVTISLSNSSHSNSVVKATLLPVEKVIKTSRRLSKEDDSTSSSLGMRNKNNTEIQIYDNVFKSPPLVVEETSAAPKEEFDFYATLMATKLQAQKMMEKSKNFWTAADSKPKEQSKELAQTKNLDLGTKAKVAEVNPRPKSSDLFKTQASLEAAKNSFWSTFATAAKEPVMIVEPEQPKEVIDLWASLDKGNNDSQSTNKKKTVNYTPLKKESISKMENWTAILKSRVEFLPQSELAEVHFVVEHSPENIKEPKVKEDFWTTVEKAKSANETTEKETKVSENYWEIQANQPELKEKSKEFCENQAADASNETNFENALQKIVEDEEIDFWTAIKTTDNTANNFEFDPTKYPEEPREVDTDEEIDFWAEIEANRKPDDDDVTFHKSATFWARKERQNLVEETPFKPMETKAFRAKLPDESAVEINVWATLKAARGEEPEIVDPVVEEENKLAVQYEELEHDSLKKLSIEQPSKDDAPETNLNMIDTMSVASMHEPVTVHTWTSYTDTTEEPQNKDEPDFWADIEEERTKNEQVAEAEHKRQNYRQSMAFFNTSIDKHKVQLKTQYNRNTVIQKAEGLVGISLGPRGEFEIVGEDGAILKQCTTQAVEPEDDERGALTPTNSLTQLPEVIVESEPKKQRKLFSNGLPDLGVEKFDDAPQILVRERINVFEKSSPSTDTSTPNKAINIYSLSVDRSHGKGQLSRNSSTQRSESEIEEDDSGVTDMNRQLSSTDTESESFPELRKMTSYQRAATHSRLFKLLQDENGLPDGAQAGQADEFQFKPSRRKIVHNVSITRRQNPNAGNEAETMTERRERLSLPLCKNTSIDADNPSTPNSPASPIVGSSPSKQRVVSDKLVNELVQSLLLNSDSTHLRKLPMERLQAAAKRALVEEMDSVESSSLDSTPAITPKQDKEYSDYYSTWNEASGEEIVPSKAFRSLQDPRRSPWTVRCPRVLSSKTINRDLARVTESPEILSSRGSKSPECFRQQSREHSVSSLRKV